MAAISQVLVFVFLFVFSQTRVNSSPIEQTSAEAVQPSVETAQTPVEAPQPAAEPAQAPTPLEPAQLSPSPYAITEEIVETIVQALPNLCADEATTKSCHTVTLDQANQMCKSEKTNPGFTKLEKFLTQPTCHEATCALDVQMDNNYSGHVTCTQVPTAHPKEHNFFGSADCTCNIQKTLTPRG